MALGTFSDLKTSIASWLARDDLTAQIPDFITLAESRMNKELRLRHMLKRANANTAAGDDTVALPANFLEARDMYVDGSPKKQLDFVTPSQFSKIHAGSETGKPVAFTIVGSEFRLGPTPDGVHTLEITFYQKIPALSDTTTSNDILVHYPDIYLYASLIEAEPFLQNDQRLQTWSSLYQMAVASATVSNDREQFSGGPLQMRSIYES